MNPPPLHPWLLCAFLCAASAAAAAQPLEGTVLGTSRIPDPQQSAYEDTLFVLKIEPHPPAADGRPVLLAVPAFLKRTLTPAAGLQTGDLVRADAEPFPDMPQEFREMQIADDFQDVSLELYGATTAERIDIFTHAAPALGAPQASEPESRLVPAQRTPAESRARAARILRDKQRIESLLASHGDWASWHASLAPLRDRLRERLAAAPEGYLRKDSIVFDHFEAALDFRLLDEDPQYAAALRVFQGMADEFALAGTSLLVVPIPQRDTVAATVFMDPLPADGVLAPYWLKFQHDLLKRDIEVVDLLPRFEAALHDKPHLYHFSIKDGHPGTDGAIVAAEGIAERLSGFEFTAPRRPFLTKEIPFVQPGVPLYYGKEPTYTGLQVIETDGRIAEAADPSAEVFIFGDSMLTAPPGAYQGHICAHLVRLMGFPMSFLKEAGGGTQISVQLTRKRDLAFFSQRKVAVFLFSFSYLVSDEKAWHHFRFLSRRPEVSVPPIEPAGWSAAVASFVPSGIEALRPITEAFPAEAVRPTPNRLVVGSTPEASRLRLPPCPATPEAPAWIRLDLVSTGTSTWHLTSAGATPSAVHIVPGRNRLILPLAPATDGGERTLEIPADAPEFSLRSLEARWGVAPTPDPKAPALRRQVACYNDARDFSTIRTEPPGRMESGWRVDAVAGERVFEIPSRPSGTGRFPTRLVLQGSAARSTACTIETSQGSVAAFLPAGHGVVSVPIPRGIILRLRIPAPAPSVTLDWIELWEDAKPPGPS